MMLCRGQLMLSGDATSAVLCLCLLGGKLPQHLIMS